MPEAQRGQVNWVVVFESNDTFAIALAKGTLEHAGIPFWMQGDETGAKLVMGPIAFPVCRFLVPEDREAEARDLMENLNSPQTIEPES